MFPDTCTTHNAGGEAIELLNVGDLYSVLVFYPSLSSVFLSHTRKMELSPISLAREWSLGVY